MIEQGVSLADIRNSLLLNSTGLNRELIKLAREANYASYAVQTENWQKSALQALRSDQKGLTPEKLLTLQDHVLNYNVEVSLVGTLARKIVAAVETLTRS